MKEQMNDAILDKIAREYAQEIIEQYPDAPDSARDAVFEWASGSEWLIYNWRIMQICANCDTRAGEDYLRDSGLPRDGDFMKICQIVAMGEFVSRIEMAMNEIYEEMNQE